MSERKITLYKVDKNGGERIWSVQIVGSTLQIRYGVVGGALQTQTEDVPAGKGGRSHDEQLISRAKSRAKKQLDKGYCVSLEKAHARIGLDASGNLKPMLAQPIKRVSHIDWTNAFTQPKYDGHRMMVEIQDGQARAWSRLGKPITSVPHILQPLSALPSGTILDGELYHHGTPLQTIASWIKRDQPESANLIYVIFDYVHPAPFIERYNAIHMMLRSRVIEKNPHLMVADTGRIESYDFVGPILRHHRGQGYEGTIIRHGMSGYEVGARSRSLVKVKQMFDEEFKCINIHESKDGWAILECQDDAGKTFRVSAPGDMETKRQTLYDAD
nr:hypothetical protein [Acidimicrobiia bacterium]